MGDCYLATFDGHGGVEAAEWAAQRLHHRIFAHPRYADGVDVALIDAFADVDGSFAEWAEANAVDAGACAIAAVLRPVRQELWTAWVGDCSGVLCRGGGERPGDGDSFDCVALSTCHDLSNMEEQKAVDARGGVIKLGGGNRLRVEGALQITRSIGDRQYRRSLSQTPAIRRTALQPSDEFVVLGSDGIFDLMKCEEVVDFIRQSKSILDELYDLQRRLLRKWEQAGAPLRAQTPAEAEVSGCHSAQFSSPRRFPTNAREGAGEQDQDMSYQRRWSVCMADEEDEGPAVVPARLQAAFDSLMRLSQLMEDLREKIADLEERFEPGPALDEAIEAAFLGADYALLASYQVVVDALLANAFTQRGSGRDNTSAVVAFFSPQTLCASDARSAHLIRRSAGAQ